jgi:hypothetical protein
VIGFSHTTTRVTWVARDGEYGSPAAASRDGQVMLSRIPQTQSRDDHMKVSRTNMSRYLEGQRSKRCGVAHRYGVSVMRSLRINCAKELRQWFTWARRDAANTRRDLEGQRSQIRYTLSYLRIW